MLFPATTLLLPRQHPDQCLVICDRGAMDWDKILEKNNLNEVDIIRDNR